MVVPKVADLVCGACSLPRFVSLTVAIVAFPVALAWGNPSLSEKAFALTGATGVCIVCYIIPIVTHFLLLFPRKSRTWSAPAGAVQNGSEDPVPEGTEAHCLLQDEALTSDDPYGRSSFLAGRHYMKRPQTFCEICEQVTVPTIVLAIGVGLSALSLYSSLHPAQT